MGILAVEACRVVNLSLTQEQAPRIIPAPAKILIRLTELLQSADMAVALPPEATAVTVEVVTL